MDHVGDVLLATGVPKALKENYPQSRIIFLTSSWSAPLLENNPFIDEIVLYDAPWFSSKRYKKDHKAHCLSGLIRSLRGKNIDLALGLRGDLRENLILFLSKAKERVGYGITGGGFLLTQEVSYHRGVHETVHLLALLNALGIRCDSLEPKLYFEDSETQEFNARLEKFGLGPKDKILSFLIGAGSSAKAWPMGHVNQFIKEFSIRHPEIKILLVGSSQTLASKLAGVDGKQVINLVGETSLRELSLLIRRSLVFVGPDSGPTHIAAALGIPTIFLYSGTNCFEQWRPLAECATVLRQQVPCAPCALEACPIEGHPCMSEILPEMVLGALESRL
jgi:lipopolysaccharide heptosyltransferase II